jgi:hypothetical protein
MYEKAGHYEEALLDINVVLTMDAKHLKARVRRARIYEAQGKLREALLDYVMAMIIEQSKGFYEQSEKTPSNGPIIDTIAKQLAVGEADKLMKKIRKDKSRDMPGKAYTKHFMESFPSLYRWKTRFHNGDR